MKIEKLMETKQEYLNCVEEAKNAAEIANAVRVEFRKQLKHTYPTSALDGKNYIFFKAKWMHGSANTGHFSLDKFSGMNGEFYLNHHELLTGTSVKQIATDLSIKVDENTLLPDSYYLMAVIYEELLYPTDEDSSNILQDKPISEYLFVELGEE